MWYRQKFFKITVGLLLILLIIYLIIQLKPLFILILSFIEALLFPTIIAGVLYYILRPFCEFLEKRKIPRILSISIIYLLFFVILTLTISFLWPFISQQLSEFSSTPKEKLKEVENKTVDIMNLFNFTALTHEQLRQTLLYYLQKSAELITQNLTLTISSIATIASYFIITPFLLFYFLKDDHQMFLQLNQLVPRLYKKDSKTILQDVDFTLASYISGQVIVSLIVAILIFIGYLVIGLKYAFLLSIIAFIFNLIPFCGPIISTVPALLIGLSHSPLMGIKVLIVVAIVHLLDLNLISPRIVGVRLQIHPVTIILLLVVGISMVGFIGLFLVVPIYAVIKVLIKDIYEIKQSKDEELKS